MVSATKEINFVVTDLDDTLWDWLQMWSTSFRPFLNRISSELELDEQQLIASFKKLHQKYHTSEASPFIDDLEILTSSQRDYIRNDSNNGKSILHQFNSQKKNNLFLYIGVLDSLHQIKSAGSCLVGYTESNSFFTKYRIKHLGLDGILDKVYAPADTGFPVNMKKVYADDYWEPNQTVFHYLPREFKKPDAAILQTIIKDFEADITKSIYIGDKLDRDIYMAEQAGVTSVWAKYGLQTENVDYDLLREVTHWSSDDVQREIAFRQKYHAHPQAHAVLEQSFSEIFDYFRFTSFNKCP